MAKYLDRHLRIPTLRTRLRPPGAIPEDDFLNTCYRCGSCVEVCPAKAILKWPDGHEQLARTPYIDPDQAPCVVCESLACTRACPSGALTRLETPQQIRMGLAAINAEACLRWAGDDCSVCVDQCPIGASALTLDGGGPPIVVEAGCVGCGVCQAQCPTRPKAITVHPH